MSHAGISGVSDEKRRHGAPPSVGRSGATLLRSPATAVTAGSSPPTEGVELSTPGERSQQPSLSRRRFARDPPVGRAGGVLVAASPDHREDVACWVVRPRVGLVRALVRPGRDDARIVGARPVRPAQQPAHHLGEFFPADQRRALLVQLQQILGAAEQAVLHVQIGQRNHRPSAMSGSTQTTPAAAMFMAPHERSGESRKPDDPQRAGESVTEKRVTTAAVAGTPNRRTAAHLGPVGPAGQRPAVPSPADGHCRSAGRRVIGSSR